MTLELLMLIAFAVSLAVVGCIHSHVVKFAVKHNIVDHPDYRKLQKTPVPVLGGLAVFVGMAAGLLTAGCCSGEWTLWVAVSAMFVLLLVGLRDDFKGLSPAFRFVVEIAVVLWLIFLGGYCIDDFHGLCGIGAIPWGAAVPLTVFAAVGIINAINLIDGVNGLSSGYCIMACTIFGSFFYCVGNGPMVLLAAVSAGALIPFFCHNVFGRRSRMFIGDSGTLVMGVVMAVFVCEVLRHENAYSIGPQYGLIPFTLAVLSVPVFDTLRVMTARILRGTSPFYPDNTHLHHMFIQLGCSHPMTTLLILLLNSGVLFGWWCSAQLGVSVFGQCAVVVVLGLLATFGVYEFFAYHVRHQTPLLRWLHRIGRYTHLSRTRFFLVLRFYVDKI